MIQNNGIMKVEANRQGRDFIVGDLHGCMAEFEVGLQAINFDPLVDRMFSVGDLIDRGPRNEEALSLLNDDWFIPVFGNHEQLMCMAVLQNIQMAKQVWFGNGGRWAEGKETSLINICEQVDLLPKIIVVGEGENRFHIVHAEIYSHSALADGITFSDASIDEWFENGIPQQLEEAILWGRTLAKNYTVPNSIFDQLSPVYCGHSKVSEIRTVGKHINIDLGACYNYHGYERWHLAIVEPVKKKGIMVGNGLAITHITY